MPRDASGVFTRTNGIFSGPTTWAQQAASPDKVISSSRHDTHDQDEADALTDSLSRSGKGAMQADLDVASFKVLNVANGTATSDGVNKGQLDGKIGNVVEDTSPQLGGNLDTNGNSIVTVSNADLNLTPNGTGRVNVPRLTLAGYQLPDAAGADGQILRFSGGNLVADNEKTPAIEEWGQSADQTMSDGALISVLYSAFTPPLTGALKELTADLVCVTAQHGYTAGQILPQANFTAPSGNRGLQIYYDDAAETAYVRVGQLGVYVFSTSGTPVEITYANWRLRLKAKR